MTTLADAIRAGLEAQVEISSVTETAVDVVGPIDLEELAEYLMTNGGTVGLRKIHQPLILTRLGDPPPPPDPEVVAEDIATMREGQW